MMKKRKYKLLNSELDDDPMSGMANLFDVSMVFAVALMVALVGRLHMQEFFSEKDFTVVKNPGQENMEIIQKKDGKMLHFKGSQSDSKKEDSSEKGQKIGTAYKLADGQIIYIPDGE